MKLEYYGAPDLEYVLYDKKILYMFGQPAEGTGLVTVAVYDKTRLRGHAQSKLAFLFRESAGLPSCSVGLTVGRVLPMTQNTKNRFFRADRF